MPGGALRPSEVEFLAEVVHQHCVQNGIRSEEARESVALSAVSHFQRGISEAGELLAVLAREDDPDAPRGGALPALRRSAIYVVQTAKPTARRK